MIFKLMIIVYLLSCIAVALWDKLVKGTKIMSWVSPGDIFFPVHNTIMAINLWKQLNPFNNMWKD